jgi:hypothetical protein
MEFVKLLVTLIIALYAKRGLPVDDTQQQRLEGVVNDEWVVTDGKSGPFEGEAAHEASTLVLASIAAHESGFWEKVQTCEACFKGSQWCDRGRSISLYQLHEGSSAWKTYTRKEICESNRIASQLAWNIVMRNKKANTSLALFNGYARGGRRLAGYEMDQIFKTLLVKTNIKLSFGKEHMVATYKNPPKKPVEKSADDSSYVGSNLFLNTCEEGMDILESRDGSSSFFTSLRSSIWPI